MVTVMSAMRLPPVNAVSVGNFHTCAVLGDGSCRCWGRNSFGEAGMGHTQQISVEKSAAVNLGANVTVKQLAAGDHTCAVLDDDTLRCWGNNMYGQLGLGHTRQIGDDAKEMGQFLPPVDVGAGRTVKQVAAGDEHTCAVLDDDTLRCWGQNGFGELGLGHTRQIGADAEEMGQFLPPVDVGNGRTVKQVAAGHRHTCAVLDDDTLRCWGSNGYGKLGLGHDRHIGDDAKEMGQFLPPVDVGAGRTVKQVAAGQQHTCAVLDDDTLRCWGRNWYGELGLGHNRNIGETPQEMGRFLPPVDVGSGRTVKQAAAGYDETCAVLDNDAQVCWGLSIGDQEGEMGDRLAALELISTAAQTQLRLNGSTALQGRLEVLYQGLWGTVCDDQWNDLDAQVACSQLGWAGGIPLFRFSSGNMKFWMDNVQCSGKEASLGLCPFRGWGSHNCARQQAAGVQCHIDAWTQLVLPGGPLAREGHSAIWDDANQSLLIFAGEASAHLQSYSDLWQFSWPTKSWSVLEPSGGAPTSRFAHTSVWDAASKMMLASTLVHVSASKSCMLDLRCRILF